MSKFLFAAALFAAAACGKKAETPAPVAPGANADPNAAERYAGSLQRDVKAAESAASRANAAIQKTDAGVKAAEQAENPAQ